MSLSNPTSCCSSVNLINNPNPVVPKPNNLAASATLKAPAFTDFAASAALSN